MRAAAWRRIARSRSSSVVPSAGLGRCATGSPRTVRTALSKTEIHRSNFESDKVIRSVLFEFCILRQFGQPLPLSLQKQKRRPKAPFLYVPAVSEQVLNSESEGGDIGSRLKTTVVSAVCGRTCD